MSKRTVPFPEAGADAFLRLDQDGLEELSQAFGHGWLAIVEAGLSGASPVIITRVLAAAIHDEDEDGLEDAPWDLALDEIGARLLDAFYLCMKGKTVAEVHADEIAIAVKVREILARMAVEEPEKCIELADEVISQIERQRRERIARRKAEAALKAEREADNSAESADIPAEPEPAS